MSDWRDEYLEANRANWDERVPIHAEGEFYDVASFREGQERLRPFELVEVGDVSGKDLVHLQCHFGIDTLSWARRGARVVGLDFSVPAVERARELAAELGLDAEFVQPDVYEAVGSLQQISVWLTHIARCVRTVRPKGLLNHSYMHGACGSTSTQYAVGSWGLR